MQEDLDPKPQPRHGQRPGRRLYDNRFRWSVSTADLDAHNEEFIEATKKWLRLQEDMANETADLERQLREARQALRPSTSSSSQARSPGELSEADLERQPRARPSTSASGQVSRASASSQQELPHHRSTGSRSPTAQQRRSTAAVQHYRHLRDLQGLLGTLNAQEQALRSCVEQMPRMQQRISLAGRRYQQLQRELRERKQRELLLESELQKQRERLATCEAELDAARMKAHPLVMRREASLQSLVYSPPNTPRSSPRAMSRPESPLLSNSPINSPGQSHRDTTRSSISENVSPQNVIIRDTSFKLLSSSRNSSPRTSLGEAGRPSKNSTLSSIRSATFSSPSIILNR